MNLNSVVTGFFTGVVCGVAFLLGGWILLLPKFPPLVKQENLKDLSHFGRETNRKRRRRRL